jgi:hypothetical protein
MKILFEDQNEISHFSQRVNEAKERTNLIIAEFNLLPLNKISTQDQVRQLIEDLPGLIAASIPPETVKTFAMLKPSKIVELLEINTTAIRQLIKESNLGFVSEFLEVSKSTKSGFEVDPKLLEKRLDSFRLFARTDKELQIAADYESLIQAAKKMTSHMSPNRFAHTLPVNLWLDIKNNEIQLRPGFYAEIVSHTS